VLTWPPETKNALHNVKSSSTLSHRWETDKRILGRATRAHDQADVGDVEGIDVNSAQSVSGEVIHREVEDVVEILFRNVHS
jgi:hypothetical protein